MRIHRIRSGMTNCWLIQWSGRTLLVDAGIAWDRRFLGHLQRTVDPHMIELLFLTHGHTDHIGHAAALQEYYGIPAALHPADLALVMPPAPDIRAVRSGRKRRNTSPFHRPSSCRTDCRPAQHRYPAQDTPPAPARYWWRTAFSQATPLCRFYTLPCLDTAKTHRPRETACCVWQGWTAA